MPFHFTRRVVTCYAEKCDKPATGEVRNSGNAPIGSYCDKHGPDLAAHLNAGDDRRLLTGKSPAWVDRLEPR